MQRGRRSLVSTAVKVIVPLVGVVVALLISSYVVVFALPTFKAYQDKKFNILLTGCTSLAAFILISPDVIKQILTLRSFCNSFWHNSFITGMFTSMSNLLNSFKAVTGLSYAIRSSCDFSRYGRRHNLNASSISSNEVSSLSSTPSFAHADLNAVRSLSKHGCIWR